MKNIKKRLIGWTLGLALSLGVGIGIASNTHSEITGVEAASTTYTHPFATKQIPDSLPADVKLSNIEWNVTGTNVGAYNSSNYAGVQFGTSKKNGSLSFKSKLAWGEDETVANYFGKTKVEQVKVWLNAGSDVPTANVTIGNIAATSDGTVVKRNSSAKSYTDTTCVTFTPANGADSGIIEISASTKSKAGYFSAIEVIATEGVQKNMTSIEITTPPTKTEYYAGEKFDPTGLVVTKTFDDNTTEDLPYNNSNKDDFTFNPASELKTTDTVVAITVGGKTVNQPITVKPARTITGVTLNGDMTNKKYYEGDTWDVSGLYLTVNWNEGKPTIVQLTSLKAGEGYTLDSNTAAIGTTSLYIHGTYNGIEFEKTVEGLMVTPKPYATLVTDIVDLWDGQEVYFASTNKAERVSALHTGGKNMPSADGAYVEGKGLDFNSSNGAQAYTIGRTKLDGTIYYTFSFVSETGIKYLADTGSKSNNYLQLSDKITDTTSNCVYFTINVANDGSATIMSKSNAITPCLKWNGNASSDGLFSCYKESTKNMKNPYLFAVTSYNETTVANKFVDHYLHMDKNVDGQCIEYYRTLKSVWAAMGELERAAVDGEPYARLQAWATANGEHLDTNKNLVSNANSIIRGSVIKDGNAFALIAVVSMVSATAIGSFFFIRKRKEQN